MLACSFVTNPNLQPAPPEDQTLCFKCKRKTSVKAVLPVGVMVYLRCDECGSAWSMAERRAVQRDVPEDTTPRSV